MGATAASRPEVRMVGPSGRPEHRQGCHRAQQADRGPRELHKWGRPGKATATPASPQRMRAMETRVFRGWWLPQERESKVDGEQASELMRTLHAPGSCKMLNISFSFF